MKFVIVALACIAVVSAQGNFGVGGGNRLRPGSSGYQESGGYGQQGQSQGFSQTVSTTHLETAQGSSGGGGSGFSNQYGSGGSGLVGRPPYGNQQGGYGGQQGLYGNQGFQG